MNEELSSGPLILALDIGTSSVRAGLYTPHAEVFPGTMVKHARQLESTPEGGFEIDAEEAFEQVTRAIDDVYSRCGEKISRVKFGAISSFWHSLIGVDENGSPTTKLIAWAETRPARYVTRLKHDLDASAVHDRTGCPFHSSYWPAKLVWLREEDQRVFERTAKWLSFPDFLGARLFGTDRTSLSMASGTGIFEIRKHQWDAELIDYLGLGSERLPRLVDEENSELRLSDEYADRWPGLAETLWLPAIGDGAANNIGAGSITKNMAALMIGTSGALRVVYAGEPPEAVPEGLWCYLVDSKRVVMGGAISDGGGLYRWLKDNLRLEADDDLTENLIAERQPDAHGLTFLPFLAGERSTGYNDFATGAILGLRNAHDAVDIVRAAMESVAYRFCEIFERLDSALHIEEIVASGGALRESPVWTQMICDVIGRDMKLPETREASSRGAVLLAAEKNGLITSINEIDEPPSRQFRANASNRLAYRKGLERHRRYYKEFID